MTRRRKFAQQAAATATRSVARRLARGSLAGALLVLIASLFARRKPAND